MNGEKGNVVQFSTFEQTDVATATLSETADIPPVPLKDSAVVITLAEYGNALVSTKFLKATSFNDIEKAATANMAVNRARSLDLVCRAQIIAGINVFRPNGRVTRATLQNPADIISFAFLTQATSRAKTLNMPPTDMGDFVAPINPILLADLVNISQWQNVSAYQQDGQEIYEGEVGKLVGVRFVQTYTGKVYLSGGTIRQAATTTTASINAGDTACPITSGTGLNNGDFVTIGTLESSVAEQVLITAGGLTTTLTIQGVGNSQSNFGFRYAHASGVAVTKADQVAALPLMGAQSVAKAYSDLTGPRGQVVL
ncbi:MAG TPA: hypothetical protein VGR03_07055, partial [Candidatus Acidoferrum sp.]|nr:hypothetical protein [Candidatus Acidoferrum sp.]